MSVLSRRNVLHAVAAAQQRETSAHVEVTIRNTVAGCDVCRLVAAKPRGWEKTKNRARGPGTIWIFARPECPENADGAPEAQRAGVIARPAHRRGNVNIAHREQLHLRLFQTFRARSGYRETRPATAGWPHASAGCARKPQGFLSVSLPSSKRRGHSHGGPGNGSGRGRGQVNWRARSNISALSTYDGRLEARDAAAAKRTRRTQSGES
ncbi:hypothetical protein K491DRAFT_674479 [Lophiostoma macrostomum CBS 122681]|uniref:Uncharacterized protein n=1 Tax=Lophiostoma macrostomum CBS 122681 TaxID=1314788 RepID=A0A6A6TPM3_9PLEO|nr:hypothetical protein K491DRAFT_674479 [Lophiostoma macrostomum CBS 122681]